MSEVQIDVLTSSGSGWRLPTSQERESRGCRTKVGPGHKACHRPPVAMLRRSRWNHNAGTVSYVWWAYCEKHCYGKEFDGTHLWFTVPADAPIVHNATIIRALP